MAAPYLHNYATILVPTTRRRASDKFLCSYYSEKGIASKYTTATKTRYANEISDDDEIYSVVRTKHKTRGTIIVWIDHLAVVGSLIPRTTLMEDPQFNDILDELIQTSGKSSNNVDVECNNGPMFSRITINNSLPQYTYSSHEKSEMQIQGVDPAELQPNASDFGYNVNVEESATNSSDGGALGKGDPPTFRPNNSTRKKLLASNSPPLSSNEVVPHSHGCELDMREPAIDVSQGQAGHPRTSHDGNNFDKRFRNKAIMTFGVFMLLQIYLRTELATATGANRNLSRLEGIRQHGTCDSQTSSRTTHSSSTPQTNKKRRAQQKPTSKTVDSKESGDDDDDREDGGDRRKRPAHNSYGPRQEFSCVLWMADPEQYGECAHRVFFSITGLKNHLQEKHHPQVQCLLCPDHEEKRWRDNWRLRNHLQRSHPGCEKEIKEYQFKNIPKIDEIRVKRGFWLSWENLWNHFCPGKPVPKSTYRNIGVAQNVHEMMVDGGLNMLNTLKEKNDKNQDVEPQILQDNMEAITDYLKWFSPELQRAMVDSTMNFLMMFNAQLATPGDMRTQTLSSSTMLSHSNPLTTISSSIPEPVGLDQLTEEAYQAMDMPGRELSSPNWNEFLYDSFGTQPDYGHDPGVLAKDSAVLHRNEEPQIVTQVGGLATRPIVPLTPTTTNENATVPPGGFSHPPYPGHQFQNSCPATVSFEQTPYATSPAPVTNIADASANSAGRISTYVFVTFCSETARDSIGDNFELADEPNDEDLQYWSAVYDRIRDMVTTSFEIAEGECRLFYVCRIENITSAQRIQNATVLMKLRVASKRGTRLDEKAEDIRIHVKSA